MTRDTFIRMVSQLKEADAKRVYVVLKSISSKGGYSSGQTTITTKLDSLDAGVFLTVYNENNDNVFNCAKDITKIVMVDYADVLAVVSIQ